MMRIIRRILIGRPLHNQEMVHEKMPKWKALSIFSSDALSSVGYGPEQIVITLAVPGLLAYGYLLHAAIAILLLLAMITISYVQVAKANPGGGGSYSVAIKNLGEMPALIAGAALFADYTLTVAVSISSGTDALVSAFPALLPHEIAIDLFALFGILMLINLRGVRESANMFVFPTYAFIFGILVLIGVGIYNALSQTQPVIPPSSLAKQPLDFAMLFLLLRAFASGCSSMTGVEAISNGIPMFKEPEIKNAAITTYSMSILLAIMFSGIAFLVLHYHIMPSESETVLSQLAEAAFGRNWFYYYIQLATTLILYLAANTSYNGLPPLLSLMARDGYMPRYLGTRGERLSFSNGIILLSVIAGILIFVFQGNTEHLISLYAIGVFLSFTIAQTGMVIHWRREKGEGWQWRAAINGLGAVLTGIVVIVIATTKFFYGAWIILIFIPTMIFIFKKIRGHYNDIAEQLRMSSEKLDPSIEANLPRGRNLVIVPISSPTGVVAQTLRYAKSISTDILAVNIATSEEAAEKVRQKWYDWNPGVELVTIYSPYRLVIQPLMDYITELEKQKLPQDYITVLIPEFETRKWWHRLMHNQTGWILRTLLILRENVIVTTIPYHLKR